MGEKCFIGIPAYNEESILPKLLDSILKQGNATDIEKIYIISSGSTDRTDEIAKIFSEKDNRIVLIREEVRGGKARAINLFLDRVPRGGLCVVSSADVIWGDGMLEKLLFAFADEAIGMASPRPVPVNNTNTLMGRVVCLLWELKHRISLKNPKTGEVIAFRKIFDSIAEDTLVDEAYIEMLVIKSGKKIAYAGDAIVHNKGPETLNELIKQRKRIYIGHKLLEKRRQYKCSTFNMALVLREAFFLALSSPGNFIAVICLYAVEAYSRFLGRIELALGRYNKCGLWDIVETSKEM